MATGDASGFFVVDIDGEPGIAAVLALQEEHGRLPPTVMSCTRRGYHLFFRMPEGRDVRNSAGKFAPSIDVRGTGGYVVVPPSPHPEGEAYRWAVGRSPDECPIADASAWLLELVTARPQNGAYRPAAPLPDSIPAGARNQTLASLAGTMRRRGFLEPAMRAALHEENQGRCNPPLADDEVDRIAVSVGRYEPGDTAGGPEPLIDELPDTTMTLGELLADPTILDPPTPLIGRLAWPERVTLFAGREKLGKSTTVMAAVSAFTAGRSWLGERTERGKALVFPLEDHPGDIARLLDAFGADHERTLIDREVVSLEHLASKCQKHQPDLVVVDTLPALVAHLAPESGDGAAWTTIMQALTRIARAGPAVIVNHHGQKATGSYRDSTAIGANVDVILEMREDSTDESVRRIKARGRVAVSNYAIRYHAGDSPYFSLADGKLSLETRVLAYIERNPGQPKSNIADEVEGRRADILAVIRRLERGEAVHNRGPVRKSAFYPGRSPQNPLGTGGNSAGTALGTTKSRSGTGGVPRRWRDPIGVSTREPPPATPPERPT